LELHPTSPSILFAAFENVWKKNGENSWEPISDLPISSTLRALRVAPSNPDVIYTSTFGTIFRTNNGGSDWVNVSGGLPDLTITAIEVDPDDDQRVWITMSGYEDGQKVYYSETGGGNWQNQSLNLPNIPVNCISYQVGTSDGLYIGTDVGVYYKDAESLNWASYNEALPNVIVNQILFHYGSSQVFIGTYGRGVWVNEFFDPSAALPVVNFNADNRLICQGDSVSFDNLSINVSENFTWYFEGGTPEFSEEVAPTITYNTGGQFEVKLLAANQNGMDSLVAVNYINVIPQEGIPAPFSEDFESTDPLEDATWLLNTNNGEPRWNLNTTVGYESSQSFWVDNFNNNGGNNDFLESTTIDLSALDTAIVTFRVAYAKKGDSALERLRVSISTDCGENWTFKKLYTSTNDLVTAEPQPNPFAPSGSGDWALMVVDNIQPEDRTENFRIQFEFRSNGGNNIYIDDINIVEEYFVGTSDAISSFASLSLFPNPAVESTRLELELLISENIQIELMDILGRKVKQIHSGHLPAGTNGIEFSTQNLAAGIYNVVLRTDSGQKTLKLVIEK
jgi:PKD repeat protein